MKDDYADLRELGARVGETPQWWDENGAPRFAPHHPRRCPDIYADEVVLLVIACQLCGLEIPVQMSSSAMDRVRARMTGHKFSTLAARVRAGSIHYGDPPYHEDRGEFCHAGCTMNCIDMRVVEFWDRARSSMAEWVRVPELEIEIQE